MSLTSETIKSLFGDASDEKKMELVSSLCKTIDYKVFLNNVLILNKLKDNILNNVEKLKYLKNEDKECLKYLIKYSNLDFETLVWMSDINITRDMCVHVKPSEWKFCTEKDGFLVVFRQIGENVIPFDFVVDVVEKNFPIDKFKKSYANKLINWYEY